MPEKLKAKVLLAGQDFSRNIIVKNDKDIKSEAIALKAINKQFKGLTKKESDLLVFYVLADYVEAFHENNRRMVENKPRVVEVKKPPGNNELFMTELQNAMQIRS